MSAIATYSPERTVLEPRHVPAQIVLTLSPEQAAVLVKIAENTGGHCERSPRKYMDEIAHAIRYAFAGSQKIADGWTLSNDNVFSDS